MLIVGSIVAVIAILAATYSDGYKHGVRDVLDGLDNLFNKNNEDEQNDN